MKVLEPKWNQEQRRSLQNKVNKYTNRELAILCESPSTSTENLVTTIARRQANINTEQDAVQHLATLATVQIASRAQMPSYTTMVQHFLGTLQLPMAIYMLDYYLPILSPNDGYNETGLTMQSAGPIREAWQPIRLSYLFKGSEFGHWKVTGGYDTFAFRHPSLGEADVRQLLESEAHHHKICPMGQADSLPWSVSLQQTTAHRECYRSCSGSFSASHLKRAKTKTSCLQPESTANAIPKLSNRSCISNHTSNRVLCRCSVPSVTNTLLGPGVWPRTPGCCRPWWHTPPAWDVPPAGHVDVWYY